MNKTLSRVVSDHTQMARQDLLWRRRSAPNYSDFHHYTPRVKEVINSPYNSSSLKQHQHRWQDIVVVLPEGSILSTVSSLSQKFVWQLSWYYPSLFDHSYHLEILSLIFSRKKKTLQNKHVKVIPVQDRYHTARIFH